MAELVEGARPAVNEENWDCFLGLGGWGVDKVDSEVLDVCRVLGELVDGGLSCYPIVVILPLIEETFGPFI